MDPVLIWHHEISPQIMTFASEKKVNPKKKKKTKKQKTKKKKNVVIFFFPLCKEEVLFQV